MVDDNGEESVTDVHKRMKDRSRVGNTGGIVFEGEIALINGLMIVGKGRYIGFTIRLRLG